MIFNNFNKGYIYTTRDVVEALKKNNINKTTTNISQYINNNNFAERKLAIKQMERIPFTDETHEIWKISYYGMNEILRYYLDLKREAEKKDKTGYTIKQLEQMYGKDYKHCYGSLINSFINKENFEQRNLAKKIYFEDVNNTKWVITQEGVNEMFKKLFVKKQNDNQLSIIPVKQKNVKKAKKEDEQNLYLKLNLNTEMNNYLGLFATLTKKSKQEIIEEILNDFIGEKKEELTKILKIGK
jgi:uncharacterized protein YrzB (UPF0473 family)